MARRGYPAEFRRRVIELVEGERKIFEVSKELGVSQQTIYVWRRTGLRAPAGTRKPRRATARRGSRFLEHETGLEPATPTLATWRSTS